MMTKVVQVAMIPTRATCRTIPMRLSGLMNAGCAAEKTIMIARIAIGSALDAIRPVT